MQKSENARIASVFNHTCLYENLLQTFMNIYIQETMKLWCIYVFFLIHFTVYCIGDKKINIF